MVLTCRTIVASTFASKNESCFSVSMFPSRSRWEVRVCCVACVLCYFSSPLKISEIVIVCCCRCVRSCVLVFGVHITVEIVEIQVTELEAVIVLTDLGRGPTDRILRVIIRGGCPATEGIVVVRVVVTGVVVVLRQKIVRDGIVPRERAFGIVVSVLIGFGGIHTALPGGIYRQGFCHQWAFHQGHAKALILGDRRKSVEARRRGTVGHVGTRGWLLEQEASSSRRSTGSRGFRGQFPGRSIPLAGDLDVHLFVLPERRDGFRLRGKFLGLEFPMDGLLKLLQVSQ
mmetsp:Transcript_28632/g.61396  ORF Transcript_28632/g.61396 Transcript_28632/m.61396 type:complete len:286 (-) Transcript_28632:338-1195(-)